MGDLTEELKFHTINVAPEGKWGYLVAIGLAIPGACFLGTFASFGLLFNDFLKSIGAGTSAVTTIFGFIAISMSASGLIASSLIRKFSLRSVGLLGAIMYTLGNFLSAFALSVEHLIISFGVFQGFGIGLILNVGYTNFNYYFVKRRVFMMSVTQVLKGLLVAAYPIVIRFLVEKYGFRGATAIIAAIHAHTIVGMMAMHPIEWHCKVIRIPVEESKPLMNTNEKESEVIITVVPDDETKGKLASTYRSSEQDLHEKTKNSDSGTQLIRSERSKSIDVTQTLDGFDPITKRISSIMSFGDLGGAVIMAETSNNKNGKWQKVIDFLDLTLFKDFIYLNMVIGIALSLYSDGTFYTLLPIYLFELEFSKSDAASVVSTGFVADLSSRVFLAVVSYHTQLKARHVYLAGAVATVFIRIVFMNVFNFYAIAAAIAMTSFFRTFMYCMIALIFAEYLPSERFASGFGLYTFIQGNLIFCISPIFGWIRDVTQSYVICFNTLTLLMCLLIVPWTTEMLWLRFRPRKNTIEAR